MDFKEIDEKIKSVQSIENIKYTKPQDRTEEYKNNLINNPDALKYLLEEREFNLDTINHFNLGLTQQNRLSIPIYKKGELIDYKFRTIPPEKKGFFRTQGSETWLFNYDDGFKEAEKTNSIILVESETDLVTLWQNGYKNTVSLVSGAMGMGNWIKEFDKIDKIIIFLDSDETGQKAAEKLAKKLGEEKCVNVVTPEKDANDFFKKYTKDDFDRILRTAKPIPTEDVFHLYDIFDKIRERKKEKDFKFGYDVLDEITGGFNRGNVIVVTADTNVGKSTFTINLTTRQAKTGNGVMYVPLEDNPLYIGERILNIVADENTYCFKDDEWEKLKDSCIDLPFFMYTGYVNFNMDIFEKIVERGSRVFNIDVYYLDHLHFLKDKKGRSEQEEISTIMKDLNRIARKFDITIVLVSHINKEGQISDGKMPELRHLKGSSAISADAHMVITLQECSRITGTVLELAVKKNREGRRTDFNIEYRNDKDTGIIKEVGLVDRANEVSISTPFTKDKIDDVPYENLKDVF